MRLRDIVPALIESKQNYDEITLSDGTLASFGSVEHLEDMILMVKHIQVLRDQYKRQSSARATYAAALRQLKSDIKRVGKRVITDLDENSIDFEKFGDSRKSKVGFGGGSSTTPGHGRYSTGDL